MDHFRNVLDTCSVGPLLYFVEELVYCW